MPIVSYFVDLDAGLSAETLQLMKNLPSLAKKKNVRKEAFISTWIGSISIGLTDKSSIDIF